jgi:uncharacterized protein (DUF952 family)
MIYKILPWGVWEATGDAVGFTGIDARDGYIHLSPASEVAETLRLHFSGAGSLALLAVDPALLPDPAALRWETSRGGVAFPHLYSPLPCSAVVRVDRLEPDAQGRYAMPPLLIA